MKKDLGDDKLSSESILWAAFKKGNREAYAKIYERYAGAMYAYGLRYTMEEELIEDTIHDIFVKLHRDRKTLPEVSNVKLYLFVALRNSLFSKLSSKNEFRLDLADTASLSDSNNIEDQIIETEREAINKNLIAKIEAVLSPRQKQIIYYRYVEQLSYREVALLMGINVQSAKNMVQIALKKIKILFPGATSLFVVFLLICC